MRLAQDVGRLGLSGVNVLAGLTAMLDAAERQLPHMERIQGRNEVHGNN
jgi:hypothetical protein